LIYLSSGANNAPRCAAKMLEARAILSKIRAVLSWKQGRKLPPHVTVTCCVRNRHLAPLDASNVALPDVAYLEVRGRQVHRRSSSTSVSYETRTDEIGMDVA